VTRPAPFITAISPYHLATREPAAMAALVLGTRAVTLLPHPSAGSSHQAVAAAVKRAPRYLRLLEAWRWSSALWRAGVVSSSADGEQAGSCLAGVYDDIRCEPPLADLRPLTRVADALADERPDAFLDALSNDLLRGGPDPGMSIPVNAALERFADRHRLIVVRSAASSIVQQAESRLATKVFAFGLPMLVDAGGERVLLLRADLEPALKSLRLAMVESFASGSASPDLSRAAREYAEAFNAWAVRLGRGDDERGHRVRTAYLGVTGVMLPADAVLRSSRAAARSVAGYASTRRAAGGVAVGAAAPESMLPTLIVREMKAAPAGA
jgi:hypothetical protein